MSGAMKIVEGRCDRWIRLYPTSWRSGAEPTGHRLVNRGLLAALLATCTATTPHAQTLTQALAEAYNTNPQLLAQRALLRATDEQVPQALSFWRPTVNFTGQVGMETASLETPGLAGRNSSRLHEIIRPNALILQATQPVYRGGRTEAQTRQAINTV